MWWLDPGKEVLNVLFNRILAPYVENLDMNQVNYGIGQGQLTLRKLRLKKGALDKFRLPVDVLEGHLGEFTLSLHWMNLGNQPVEVLIKDVYLLVVPSTQSAYDPEEEEKRAQAAKLERLENAELLHMRGQAEQTDSSPQQQGLLASLTAKIINNLQITVQNIHIRYEDKMSVPGHPFAAGVTLAGFTAVSVNEDWQPTFIESTAGAIHKLAKLESLALYFDTDSPSMAGLPLQEAVEKFNKMIAHDAQDSPHQFILKPVSGEGRIIMNHNFDNSTPRFDVQLLFNEIGVTLDDNQYRDVISLLDMYHVYIRQHQYRKYRPSDEEFETNAGRARLNYVGTAILENVRQRRRQWTWQYFAERRDDRLKYVELFQKKILESSSPTDSQSLEKLEKKLTYEDLRFYRSIARSKLKKDTALRKRLEAEKPQQPQKQSWGSWLWGSSSSDAQKDPSFGGTMTDEQRKQLYDVLDYDEKSAVAEALDAPRDSLKARIKATLNKGSFALRSDPHGKIQDIISVNFDAFQANVIQRPDNLEASVSLGGFAVFDGTTANSVHPQIVQVKDLDPEELRDSEKDDPFLFIKYEHNPLDERADNALTARMRHMEIIYHKGYVEAVYKFLKPPASQLESVEALLNVASQTLEGLRKETRAGLEFALQNHKTIDIQMDMNAPIIIIPEDVTTPHCKHLIVDAGHIAIESELADKETIRAVQLKRSQQYSDEDYRRLEALMYDKLSLKLHSAQFVIGNDLQSCRDALKSNSSDSLHLLERINIDLQIQNSIVPTAFNLARFKVSGKLPSLQVNLSDTKYKSLMRLIDVCIPKFDDPSEVTRPREGPEIGRFPLVPGSLFSQAEQEYHVEEDDGDENAANTSGSQDGEEVFFEAEEGVTEHPEIHQHLFELTFQVDQLGASLSKTGQDGLENPLGSVTLERFDLKFGLAKYDMKVDVNLRSMSMDLVQTGSDTMKFMSTESHEEKDLLSVRYVRVQQESPEFSSVYEGIEQSVDVTISTFIFHAAPEPVLMLYDFIMTTFVPESNNSPGPGSQVSEVTPASAVQVASGDEKKIKVSVILESVQVALVNESMNLATLSLSTADVTVVVRPKALLVTGRLGSLALSNDSDMLTMRSEFNQLMSIEGENFAEFRYETFDPEDKNYAGIKSSISLSAGSIKLHFLEEPLHDIYLFLAKLAKLKGLYDAATQAAVQTASEMDTELLQFNISIKSPIIIFPSNPTQSSDMLVLRLGEVSAKNSCEGVVNKINASLRGIQLTSNLIHNKSVSVLKMIDDINITADVLQTAPIDRTVHFEEPDTRVSIHISDVKLHLTQIQYGLLINLSQTIPRVLVGAPEGASQAESKASELKPKEELSRHIDPTPDATAAADSRTWPTLDLVVDVDTVRLHLYDQYATEESNLKEHGIARFALNHNNLRLKMLAGGGGEAQVVLKSFTVSNTRPGNTKFREIIPAAQHDRNQFMILYTMSSNSDNSSLVLLTIDSPQVIFAVDPVFALIHFFTSAFPSEPTNLDSEQIDSVPSNSSEEVTAKSSLDFRVDLHDVSISVLGDDSDSDSQSIQLSIKQILLSQQGITALTVNQLGMSLMQMGRPADTVRFLDDFDLTFSLDSRSSTSQLTTNIELNTRPIIFRASYRDINLISAIVNKAIALSSNSTAGSQESGSDPSGMSTRSSGGRVSRPSFSKKASSSKVKPVGKARIMTSKEQFKGSLDGFRLVLIGDLHEQPMLHLKVKPFIIGAKDWSGELSATTTLATQISYWNLTNSHWEPLIDPWTFSVSLSKENSAGALNVNLLARERLDVNLSTTFAELAMTTMNLWNQESEHILDKARGSYAPYRIRNRTGYPVFIWTDDDGSSSGKDSSGGVQLAHSQTIDWRFDDWKTMREHVSNSEQHNIGIRFVNKSWEHLRSVPVDREGEFVFPLKPKTEKHTNRLLCEIRVVDNVKLVTIRSTYKVENQTLYPLEITLVDDRGHPIYSLEKVAPGQDYALPIEAVNTSKIRIQPDQGFGYKWCNPVRWEDLVTKKSFTIRCPHSDPQEAAFRFQAWVQSDLNPNDSLVRKYPKINLKLRAPLELENLLPYNVQYRVYDKDTDSNWKSFLRQGGLMPVHSVELSHLVLLNIEVQDTIFKPSDFAIINTDGNGDFDVENRLTLLDQNDRKLNLKLNYIRYPDSGGAFKVQIYSPYIVVNKTGLPFGVKSVRSNRAISPQDVAGDTNTNALIRPTPFMLSHTNDQGHEFSLRLGESAWSKPVSVEAPAAEIALIIPSQKQKADEIHVGVSWAEGLGKYKLSKVMTLAPRFILRNNLSEPISFREHGVAPREKSVMSPGERCSLNFIRASTEKLLTVAYPGLNAQWSAPFNIEDIGTQHFRLKAPGDTSDQTRLIRVDVKIDGSTIFVYLSSGADDWPFVVENGSDHTFTLWQKDSTRDDQNVSSKPPTVYTVNPHANFFYAWDQPAARDKKIVLCVNGSKRTIDVMEIGDLIPFKFLEGQKAKAVSLDVRADGDKQVLSITNYNAEQSLYKPRRASTGTLTRQDTTASSVEAFEAVTEELVPTFGLQVQFSGIGVSLVNRRLVEVVYVSLNALTFEYTNSTVAQSFNVSCGTLQIDNQLHDALYPVILQPTPLPKDSATLPTVQASIILLKDETHGVLFVKYCSILLQALTIEADEDLLFSIYDLTQIKGASWERDTHDILIEHLEDIPEPKDTATGQALYFEVLELQPIKLSLSFMRTERVSSEEKLSLKNPLAVVLNAFTMAVGNINDAPLEMNALAIKDMRLTTPELQSRIMLHYRQNVLRQLYRILGSADFIGNPVGLFESVSSGVADIFYEPFNGVVMHGNKEIGIGIAKGAASFVKKTVFGLSDSMTKFTSSVGKGLSAATFDSEYQARRRMVQRRNKPKHAIYGVAAGGEAFASSVASAMEGVLMKPLEGAESEGAVGFFKGMGKGIVGAVTKPVVGVFDLASNVSEGIRNTTTVFDSPERDRVRQPRLVPHDSVLRPYSAREAMGQYWMKDLNNGAYRRELYVAHINTAGSDNVVLLTMSRVLSFWSKKLRLDWELPLTQVQGITVEDTGIRFAHKSGKENDKFVFIPDKAQQSWLFERVAFVVKTFNSRKRMDA